MQALDVIIPCYNAAATLPRAVHSVLTQTGENGAPFPLNIYLVVDVDTRKNVADATEAVAKDIATSINKDAKQAANNVHTQTRAHVLHAPQGKGRLPGPGAVRNTGLRAGTAPLVAFLDADDTWAPGHLQRAEEAFKTHTNITLFFGITQGVTETGKHTDAGFTAWPETINQPFMAQGLLVDRCACSTSGVVAPRPLLQEAGGFPETLLTAQDWWLWMHLAHKGPVFFTGKVECYLTLHAASHTGGGQGFKPTLAAPAFARLARTAAFLEPYVQRTLSTYTLKKAAKRLQYSLLAFNKKELNEALRMHAKAPLNQHIYWLRLWAYTLLGSAAHILRKPFK